MCAVRKYRSGAGAKNGDLRHNAVFDPPEVYVAAIDDDVIGRVGIPW